MIRRPPLTTKARGHIMVNFAVTLGVLLGLLALGIDGSYLFSVRVGVRSAADLAALAGAMSLPSAAAATTAARQIAQANGFQHGVGGVTVDVNIPPLTGPNAGDSSKIEVIIKHPTPTFFAAALAVYNVDVRGRAVSGLKALPGFYAVYAHNDLCAEGIKGLEWSGSNTNVTGRVHSNSELVISGSNNTFGDQVTSYNDAGHSCLRDPGGPTNTYPPGEPHDTGFVDWPVYFTVDQFPCTWDLNGASTAANAWSAPAGKFDINNSGPWWVGGSSSAFNPPRLKAGVYCARDNELVLGVSGIRGEDGVSPASVTFVLAKTIASCDGCKLNVSSSTSRLDANTLNVLTLSEGTGDSAINLSGGDIIWSGWHFAEFGTINLSGSSNATLIGGFIGERFKGSGSGWGITGTIPGGGSFAPAIFE